MGKRGVSVRLGGRGFGLTLGTSGARVSAGIPGTGIYMTKKLSAAGAGGGRTRVSTPPVPEPAAPKPEPGTQPPTTWLATTILLTLFGFSELPPALLGAAVTGWVTWRGYRSPKYVALKEIRAARKLAGTNAGAADEAVRAAAARAADSWTVQREAAAYFVARDDLNTALEYFGRAIRLWPGDPRGVMLQACAVADEAGNFPWIIETLEPHVASMRPDESDLDVALLGAFALAQVGVGQPGIALEITKRLPLQRRNLTTPLLVGLCVRALAKHALGQKASARRDLDRVYAADPGFPLLQRVEELMEAGTAGQFAPSHR